MRAMRSTLYPPSLEGMTIVVRERDMAMPLEEIAADEFGFTIMDIFEVPDDYDIMQTTEVAFERFKPLVDDEKNMAIMFYWSFAKFEIVAKNGVLMNTELAPLSPEQVEYVHKALKRLDEYDGFIFITPANDGTLVTTTKEGTRHERPDQQ